jgi:hypothetical protein
MLPNHPEFGGNQIKNWPAGANIQSEVLAVDADDC